MQPDAIAADNNGNTWFTAPSQNEKGQSIYLGEPSQDQFEVSNTSGQLTSASSLGTQVDNITDNEVSGVWWTAPSQDELGQILLVRAIR